MSDTDHGATTDQYRDIADVKDALGISGRVVAIDMDGPQVIIRTEHGDEPMRDGEIPRQRVVLDPNDETRGCLLRSDGHTEVVRVEHPDDVLDSLLAGIQSEIDELQEEHKRRAAESGAPPAVVDMIGRTPDSDVGTVESEASDTDQSENGEGPDTEER